MSFRAINNDDWIVGAGLSPTSGDDERGFIIKPPPGDVDHDGYLRMVDFNALALAMSGPHEQPDFVPPSESDLETFDFTPTDGDIDLKDFASFQQAFEG